MGSVMSFICLLLISSCGIDCSSETDSYDDGYTHGKIISHANDASSTSCQDYAQMMANQGLSVNTNACWCAGFDDGKLKKENKYKKN